MDLALIVTSVVGGLISLVTGLVQTEKVDENLFVEPALRAIKNIKESINREAANKCPDCPNEFVKPFIQISLRRIQLAVCLGSLSVAFITQALYIYGTSKDYTAFISFLLWAMLPGTLVLRYILELRDVFDWWKKPLFRNALAFTVITVGGIVALDPFYLDILGWFIYPKQLSIGSLNFFSLDAFYILIALFITFLFIRYLLNRIRPSFKTKITRHLANTNVEYTLQEWVKYINPSYKRNTDRLKEKTLDTLRELIYQGIMKIEIRQRDSEPVYKAAK